MIVAVLGAAGFIGSNLTRALAGAGHFVRCFDQGGGCFPNFDTYQENISFFKGNFFSRLDLEKVLEGCDVCCHLISTSVPLTSNLNPSKDAQENIGGTLRMLDVARDVGVKKIIFPSSGGAIYGITHTPLVNESHETVPMSSYGIAKLAVEKYLALYQNLYGLDYASLRIANPYGPFQRLESRQGVIGVFFGCILRGEPITVWGDGSVIRDYLFIDDLIQAFLAAVATNSEEKIFNIGSGRGYSINDLIESMRLVTQKSFSIKYAPGRNLEIPYSVLDITRAKKSLNWLPAVNLDQGLERTWHWILSAYQL